MQSPRQIDTEPDEALDALADERGQTYVTSSFVVEYLMALAPFVTDEYVREHSYKTGYSEDHDDSYEIDLLDRGIALSNGLKEAQRLPEDARGIVSVLPHQQVVTYDDVSQILAEAICGEAHDTDDYVGAGFSADSRHETNIEAIREAID